jgi:hypothetical protein
MQTLLEYSIVQEATALVNSTQFQLDLRIQFNKKSLTELRYVIFMSFFWYFVYLLWYWGLNSGPSP